MNVDSSTTVVVQRDPEDADCELCTTFDGSTPDCSPTEKTLTNLVNLTLEFSCPQPQNVYSVKIKKRIGKSLINLLRTGKYFSVFISENEKIMFVFFLT